MVTIIMGVVIILLVNIYQERRSGILGYTGSALAYRLVALNKC